MTTATTRPSANIVSLPNRRQRPPHRLRVLLLNYEYPPMGGGAGNATHCTALELSRRGHSVHVVTSRLPGQSDIDTDGNLVVYRSFSRRKSIHQAGLLGAATYLISAFLQLRRLARTNDYDVVHFYFGLPTGLLALYVSCVLRKPYVLALRGSDVPGYDNTRWYLRPIHRLLRPLTRFIWSKAANVTALSQNLRALAQSTTPDLDIRVIPNGINASLFPPKTPEDRIGPVRLLCVCRLVRRKGLKYLVQAMQQLSKSGITLEIIGTGERETELRALVDSMNLDNAINLIGYVPQERLADYYKRADIFVLPSISESFGQVLLEAMSSELPIIASRVGGIPETVHDALGGSLIEPASSRAIIGAVLKLANEPKTRQRMAAYNRKLAETNYQWSAIADQYESLYFHALNDSRRAKAETLQ